MTKEKSPARNASHSDAGGGAKNLSSNLKRLSEITDWFENQEEIDVEEGLEKVKEAAALIKASKERLKSIENEFEEIKKDQEK